MFDGKVNVDMSNKRLDAGDAIIIAAALEKNDQVLCLHVSNCSMSTAAAEAFGAMLSENTPLKTLDVSDTSFGKPALGDQVKLKSSGETRTIDYIDWGGAGKHRFQGSNDPVEPDTYEWESQFPALCAGLKCNSALESLDASKNGLGPAGGEVLADVLKTNSVLTVLNVSSNGLDQSIKDKLTKHKTPQLTLIM
jgi:Ran GTPase-activating protein (RanGAP) involved in mRNA processing and transport